MFSGAAPSAIVMIGFPGGVVNSSMRGVVNRTRLSPGTETKVGEDGTLHGIGVSAGSYTGPVRVIRNEQQLDRLQPGDVFVCPPPPTKLRERSR